MSPLESVARANKDYVAEQYRRYQADPDSVDDWWKAFFAGFELGAAENGGVAPGAGGAAGPPAEGSAEPAIGAFDLIHSYRELGHLVAHLNPLAPPPADHPLLHPSEFGFEDADLDRVVRCGSFRGCATASLRELIARLRATYCRTLGVEYLHIQDQAQRRWLQERMEPTSNDPQLTGEEKLHILSDLIAAESF